MIDQVLVVIVTNATCYVEIINLLCRKTSTPIKMQEGTTIAAYVALTHTPVRTNEILGVRTAAFHNKVF